MKKISSVLLATILGLGGVQAQMQRTCASHDHMLEQMAADPTMAERMEAIENHTANFEKNGGAKSRVVYTIPVVVHVVYNTTAQNISDAQVQSQITVLNNDFRKLNSDASLIPSAFSGVAADCEINFCLAQRTPSGAATTGIVRKQTTVTSWGTNDAVKYTAQGGDDAWNTSQYLNLWVCNLGSGLLGYAQFPGGTAATDGVVILYSAFGNTGTVSAPYNKGRTATHEVGHWLNLRHIWGDATCGSDLVSDTPTHNDANYGCPTYPHLSTCTGTPTEMTMNYMDYTDDACMYMFTAGQKTRMQAVLATGGARASLASSLGCQAPTTTGCGTPASLAASSITTTGATVSWGAVTGAVSYNLQYKTSAATTWTTVTGITTTSKALTGLTAGTTYNYQVQAVCSSATGTYSAAASFTTTAATCSDAYETNNTVSAAKTLSVNTSINALIGTSTDVDWFKFTTTSTAPKVKISLTNLPGDYDVALYNSTGATQLGISQNAGTTSETILYNTPTAAATYTVKVYGYGGAYSSTACYNLAIATSATNFVRLMGEEEDGIKALTEVMTIYPNPTADMATVVFNAQENAPVEFAIFDAMGRNVNVQITAGDNKGEYRLDLSNVTNGIYFVRAINGSVIETKRLVVAH